MSIHRIQACWYLAFVLRNSAGTRVHSTLSSASVAPPHPPLTHSPTAISRRVLLFVGVGCWGREHEGSVVRHDTYVFLDVTWLAKILKPLLNHRDDEDPFSGRLSLGDTGITLENEDQIACWSRLKEDGILKPALAKVLWPGGLCDYVLPTLDLLGLTHPLDGDVGDGLLVLLRLGEERPKDVGKELDDFRRDHTAVLSVTWKVFMGAPPGAIEKVLTRCCSIGSLRIFWRFGMLVQGGFGAVGAGKTFALLMEYSHDTNEIDMKVYGNIVTAAPWAALSFGLSALRAMCLDFPGLRWRASLQCPQHEKAMQISSEVSTGMPMFCAPIEGWSHVDTSAPDR